MGADKIQTGIVTENFIACINLIIIARHFRMELRGTADVLHNKPGHPGPSFHPREASNLSFPRCPITGCYLLKY
jgi:hypothetical protein